MRIKTKLFLALLFSIFYFLFSISPVFAVTLYLEPQSPDVHLGDTFIEEIRINTKDENINAVEVYLTFPTDILDVLDFSLGNSILTVMAQGPTIDQENGLISFIGGIPGGYSGRIPGDPGESNLLVKIIFYASGEGEAEIKFKQTSRVLLNDGLGTEADLGTQSSYITILAEEPELPEDDWQEELMKDTIPPEAFQPQISRDPAIFGGQYFLSFSTTDKQTGIDYYQVKEGVGDWQRAASPYLLKDQKLKSVIKVKAVDKAGNERVEITGEKIKPAKKPSLPTILWIIIALGLVIIVWIFIRAIYLIYGKTKRK